MTLLRLKLQPDSEVCYFLLFFYYRANRYLRIDYTMSGDDRGGRGSSGQDRRVSSVSSPLVS